MAAAAPPSSLLHLSLAGLDRRDCLGQRPLLGRRRQPPLLGPLHVVRRHGRAGRRGGQGALAHGGAGRRLEREFDRLGRARGREGQGCKEEGVGWVVGVVGGGMGAARTRSRAAGAGAATPAPAGDPTRLARGRWRSQRSRHEAPPAGAGGRRRAGPARPDRGGVSPPRARRARAAPPSRGRRAMRRQPSVPAPLAPEAARPRNARRSTGAGAATRGRAATIGAGVTEAAATARMVEVGGGGGAGGGVVCGVRERGRHAAGRPTARAARPVRPARGPRIAGGGLAGGGRGRPRSSPRSRCAGARGAAVAGAPLPLPPTPRSPVCPPPPPSRRAASLTMPMPGWCVRGRSREGGAARRRARSSHAGRAPAARCRGLGLHTPP